MPLSPYRVLKTFRYAMYFDGVDDYVEVSASTSLSSQFALMGWFLFPSATAGSKGVVQKNPQINDYDYMLYLSIDGYPSVYFKNPSGAVFYAGYSVDHRDNRWHHWASTFDGRYLKMYVDAVLRVTTDTGGTTVRTSSTPLTIGYGWGGYVNMFSSQVLIYSRALSDQEIQWNYLYPNSPIRDGLVVWLKADPNYVKDIDGDGILEWIDLSGFNNHGKIYGARLVQLIKSPLR